MSKEVEVLRFTEEEVRFLLKSQRKTFTEVEFSKYIMAMNWNPYLLLVLLEFHTDKSLDAALGHLRNTYLSVLNKMNRKVLVMLHQFWFLTWQRKMQK